MAEECNHRDGKALNDEAGRVGGELTVGRDAGALIRILSHDGRQGGIGHIVDDVYDAEQDVGDPSVDELRSHAHVWRREGQDADDAKRYRCPENPRAEFAPPRGSPVGDYTHDGAKNRDSQPYGETHVCRLRRSEAESVRVEVQLKCNHELENEVCSHVAETVAELFLDRKSCNGLSHMNPRLLSVQSLTCKITFCKSESREELPTRMANSPGSTT